jgi:hypothetical protein
MSTLVPMPVVQSKEIAFYYPGPMWHHDDWIKTMILFFDGIGILLPNYLHGKPEHVHPEIALPLREKQLLHYLEPETIVDADATQKLSDAMMEVIKSGALDKLDKKDEFHEISASRLRWYGDEKVAQDLFHELKARGLARDSEDTKSIPMHYMVRGLILVMLSQILRPHGAKLGADLSPATDRPEFVTALHSLVSIPDSPSAAHVVSKDLETVAVDLRLVPIDEVLSFRTENLKDHRAYINGVHRFTRELSVLSGRERAEEMIVRTEELKDLASKIQSVNEKAWNQPVNFGLGMLGAFWALAKDDYVGAALAAARAVTSMKGESPVVTGAYSYLFKAARRGN